MDRNQEKKLMRRAVALARRARPSPNPPVGALIVKRGKVIAAGFHARAGEDHAEIAALKAAGPKAAGAELIVTLEPCHLHGRTPPCTDAIIKAKIRKVHVGTLDPSPAENGKSAALLERAGLKVSVEEGREQALCRELIEPWRAFITTHLPFVRLKAAVSVDGKIAAAGGDAKWISGKASRKETHRLRSQHDAVMVGVRTLLKDDPRLTVRDVPFKGENPVRVIVDSHLRTPTHCNAVQGAGEVPTIVAFVEGDGRRLERLGVRTIKCRSRDGRVSLDDLLKKLGRLSITSVLVEGGGGLITSFLDRKLADAITLFIAPIIVGGTRSTCLASGRDIDKINKALRIRDVKHGRLGDDIMLSGRLR
ncbi:MAG: bifunctional diaminohydroxyphosphoribosylaminopyrimidine deaminase/5-amino-6-(5-phosphoribosylamino)uracil reductase RibD [Pseudomonadota bacterium]